MGGGGVRIFRFVRDVAEVSDAAPNLRVYCALCISDEPTELALSGADSTRASKSCGVHGHHKQ